MRGTRVGAGSTRAWAVAIAALAVLAAGCSGSSGGSTATPASATTTTPSGAASTTSGPGGAPTRPSTSAGTDATTSTLPTFENASDGPRSAPASGTGTALLTAVRVAPHPGYERIVFEFSGSVTPGYRIEWVTGPIVSDGSGLPVDVKGAAHLQMTFESASGVDPNDATPTYTGPDRIAVPSSASGLTDLVRTGDFEAVLTWVAGAAERVPFRVLALSDPARLAIDVQVR